MLSQLPLNGLRALVVEDEYFVAEDLKHILMKQGAEAVRLSASISDAILQIQDATFDFALLDINVRGEPAYSIADAFLCRSLPFAFVSGYGRAWIPLRFNAIPNWGKPYDEQQIVSGIQALWAAPL